MAPNATDITKGVVVVSSDAAIAFADEMGDSEDSPVMKASAAVVDLEKTAATRTEKDLKRKAAIAWIDLNKPYVGGEEDGVVAKESSSRNDRAWLDLNRPYMKGKEEAVVKKVLFDLNKPYVGGEEDAEQIGEHDPDAHAAWRLAADLEEGDESGVWEGPMVFYEYEDMCAEVSSIRNKHQHG